MPKILAIDPGDDSAFPLGTLLLSDGHQAVFTAKDMEAADMAVKEQAELVIYNLAIKDVMPRMALDRFLERQGAALIPLLFIAPSAEDLASRTRGLKVEESDALVHPFQLDQFQKKVQDALGNRGNILKMFGKVVARPKKGQQTVLIVEDTAAVRRVEKRFIESGGYYVLEAADGAEALALLRMNPVDVIVMDIMMPTMDGYTLTRTLKADPILRKIPIILCTAKNQKMDVIKGRQAGADDYVVKPFTRDTIVAKVDHYLKPKGQEEQAAAPAETQ